MQHRDQNEARHGENIEAEPRQTEDVARKGVDQAGVGAEQIDEGDRGQERRREIGEIGGQGDERLARYVRARHRPGQRQSEQQAEQSRPSAQNQRVEECLNIKPARESLGEIFEGEAILTPDTSDQQEAERQYHEYEQGDDRAAHDEIFQTEQAREARRWPLLCQAERSLPAEGDTPNRRARHNSAPTPKTRERRGASIIGPPQSGFYSL